MKIFNLASSRIYFCLFVFSAVLFATLMISYVSLEALMKFLMDFFMEQYY